MILRGVSTHVGNGILNIICYLIISHVKNNMWCCYYADWTWTWTWPIFINSGLFLLKKCYPISLRVFLIVTCFWEIYLPREFLLLFFYKKVQVTCQQLRWEVQRRKESLTIELVRYINNMFVFNVLIFYRLLVAFFPSPHLFYSASLFKYI